MKEHPPLDEPAPWSRDGWTGAGEEPEPDWAKEIRERRKARGDRLRDVFAAFDRPEGAAADLSRERDSDEEGED